MQTIECLCFILEVLDMRGDKLYNAVFLRLV